jgi:hypothetical protein
LIPCPSSLTVITSLDSTLSKLMYTWIGPLKEF